MARRYDITTITVRPGTHPQSLAILSKSPLNDASLLACWFSDIGTINQILLIRDGSDDKASIDTRLATLSSEDPLGLRQYVAAMAMDTFVSLDFMPPMRPGQFGPCYEVRTYMLKPDGLAPTIELWRKAVPGRSTVSPLLAAMTSVTGAVTRFMHIWPYATLNDRARLRDKAVADGVWPPPGGPSHLVSQQVDIYYPAEFSPMR